MKDTIELFRLWIGKDFHINVDTSHWIIIGVIAVMLIIGGVRKFLSNGLKSHEVEMSISLGGLGEIKIKPNHQVTQIAHKAWTELVTRKAGLSIDIEHDVIIEVYNSWYSLFNHIRELIMEIPAQDLQNTETQKLIKVLIDSLNNGLRPHLTKWQAKFRRWYELNSKKSQYDEKNPQEIQKEYPEFQMLTEDLLRINAQIVDYANQLKKLI